MADVVRCVGCGARFKVADAAKVVRAKVACKKCGDALQEDVARPAGALRQGGEAGDDEYDFKPAKAAPAAPAARAASSGGAAAPAIVVPAILPGPRRRVYTDEDLAGDEDTESFFGRNKKMIIAISSAVVPIVFAIIIAVVFTGGRGGKGKRAGASKSGSSAVASAAATPRTPSAPPPPPVITPPKGVWPLPAGVGGKAKAKFLDGSVQLARTDLPPRGFLFTGRDIGQAVIVSSPTDFNGCWLDRYDLTSGQRVGTIEMPANTVDRGRVTDLSPDGNWLLIAKGRHLDVWSIEADKGERASDVEIVDHGAETPLWSGLAAPDIVLLMYETDAGGDRLMSFTPRPASAPPVDLGTVQGENERKRDMRWSRETVQTFTPRFTPDRRLIAYWADGAVQFADPATGKVVSTLPSQSNRAGTGIAFDEACTRAAVVWRDLKVGFLSVYDLKTGQTLADFPLTAADASVAPRRWLGADHVLLDDGSVVDVKRGAPIWRYEYANRLIQAVPHPDERFWFMALKPKGEASLLAVTSLPRPQEKAAAGDASGAFAATRAMPVAVQLQMTGPSEAPENFRRRMQAKVEARLKQFGMVPTAKAAAKLKVTASFVDTGESAEVRNAYGGSSGGPDKVALKSLVGTVTLDDGAGSKPVRLKEFDVGTPAHDNMPLKPGKSAADVLQDMQWDNFEGEVDDFVVPSFLERNPKVLPHSKLEP
jgi:hypothetical protein